MKKNKIIFRGFMLLMLGIIFTKIIGVFYDPITINTYIKGETYGTPANNAFASEVFYKCVVDAYNKANKSNVAYNTSLSDSQLKSIENLECENYVNDDTGIVQNIGSLVGIEKLTSLKTLKILGGLNYDFGQMYSTIDLSNNLKLETLEMRVSNPKVDLSNHENLKYVSIPLEYVNLNKSNVEYLDPVVICEENCSLDVSEFPNLKHLYIINDNLSNLKLNNNLETLEIHISKLTKIDLTNNLKLNKLIINNSKLSSIDLSNNVHLNEVNLWHNNLKSINLQNNVNLKDLNLAENEISQINLSGNLLLELLDVSDNKLSNIDVSMLSNLEILSLTNNKLENLDVTHNLKLGGLHVDYNELTTIDVSKNTELTALWLVDNNLTNIDLSKNNKLVGFNLGENQLTTIDLSNNPELEMIYITNNKLTELDLTNNKKVWDLVVAGNNLKRIIGYNPNKVEMSNRNQTPQVSLLNIRNNYSLNRSFTLTHLNNSAYKTDFSEQQDLKKLELYDNEFSDVDVSKNTNLEELHLQNNALKNLDLSNNNKLILLKLSSNKFEAEYAVYKGDTLTISESKAVILPKNKKSELIDENGYSKTFTEAGQFTANLTYQHNVQDYDNTYDETYNIYVLELTSDKYKIEKDSIDTGDDTSAKVILDNISTNYGNVVAKDNEILVKYDGDTIKSFKVINTGGNKITDIDNEIENQPDAPLEEGPQTGINYPTIILLGSFVVLVAAFLILKNKNKVFKI